LNTTISDIIEFLPHRPGVYQFINNQKEIIYVGKAKDLKKRVSSYFNRKTYESAKLRLLVSKVDEIKHIEVESESDALLLENNLIKKLRPRYNILLKDDKTYPWICIKNEPFPRVFSTRRIVNDGSRYFGPYTSGVLLKTILELLKALYPIRTCGLTLTKSNIESGKFKPCLEFQIGNCKAPCVGNQSETEYQNNIDSIIQILTGNIQTVKRLLHFKMKEYSKSYEFEQANVYKEKLATLERFQAKSTIVNPKLNDIDVFSLVEEKSYACVNYIKVVKGSVIQSHNLELKKYIDESKSDILSLAIAELRQRTGSKTKEMIVPFKPEFTVEGCKYTVPNRGDKLKLLELSLRNAKAFVFEKNSKIDKQEPHHRLNRILETMQRDFRIKELPRHIECFDNSNLQGTNPTSACVVFKNAKPAKKDYRLFNVKTVFGSDDFATMTEVVERRYKRLKENHEPLPQLVIIDGGKGQLSAAYSALKKLSLENDIKVIGIAKRLEEIFFYGDPIPIYLDKNSESLKVVQNARNEAHRFSLGHHRRRRSIQSTESQLIKLHGIGQSTLEILFKTYKSISAIRNANKLDLQRLIGKKRADIIIDHLGQPDDNIIINTS
jgi:excinuclease ABC subunit C